MGATPQSENPLDRERKGFSVFAPIEDEIKERAKEDPFARFLLEGWRQVVTVLLVVVAIVYIKNSYVKNQEASLEYAADRFAQVRLELDALREAQQAAPAEGAKPEEIKAPKAEDAAKKFNEGLRALEETRAPYNELAPLYAAMGSLLKGETVLAGELPAGEGPARLAEELKQLVVARSKLDVPASAAEGRQILERLAAEGSFVGISAALSLARIAQTPDERSKAAALLSRIEEQHPEQVNLVDPELKRLNAAS